MQKIVFEKLASILEEAIGSIVNIALNDGNELVVFFREGTNEKTIKKFVLFFHVKITDQNGKIKHKMFAFNANNQRITKHQLFFRTKKQFPLVRKEDIVTIFTAVPPREIISRKFVL